MSHHNRIKTFTESEILISQSQLFSRSLTTECGCVIHSLTLKMVTDDELSRLAEQALLQEAKRGAIRAEISGPSGWLKKKLPSTNKKFLHNTLLGALAANRVKDRKEKNLSEIGRRKRQLEEKEQNAYKKVYIQASSKRKQPSAPKSTPSKKVTVEDPKNNIEWSEDGLEFTNASVMKKNGLKKKNSYKHEKSNGSLPRKINFVSSEHTLLDESQNSR
ncbi:protein POLR1D-like [Palaemon carinicauda]|uniref:protein POLR1D-like n=1 Tax=Palaemon carinicauda TaxID=392227 RepID=UPI0035B5C542